VQSDGKSVYDFLGGAINATYKNGWHTNVQPAGASFTPKYPGTSEWTIDWVSCLLAAQLAEGRFDVIELGAGYGQWMVTSILAFKQLQPSSAAHGTALEADQTHYRWLQEHAKSNLGRFSDVSTTLLHAAAGYDGYADFPEVENPSVDYGAAYGSQSTKEVNRIPCLSLPTIYEGLRNMHVNLLHCDIQGAEQDLISHPNFGTTLDKTRVALIGTHHSTAVHIKTRAALCDSGFRIAVDWPRNAKLSTSFGELQTFDGAILAVHEEYFSAAGELVDFEGLQGRPTNTAK
jgi:FkbM family methyltransferase